MLALVMGGMLIPFAGLHYLDYISMTWRVGWRLALLLAAVEVKESDRRNFAGAASLGSCSETPSL